MIDKTFPKTSRGICSVDGCARPSATVSQLCNTHRQKLAKYGHATKPHVSLRKLDGLKINKWLDNYMRDQLTSNEAVGEALAWLVAWISDGASTAGKHQDYFRNIKRQTDNDGYIKILTGAASLVAISMDNPHRLETGQMLVTHVGRHSLFATTELTHKSYRHGEMISGSYYAGKAAINHFGISILDEVGKELAFLANRCIKLSPHFNRRSGM